MFGGGKKSVGDCVIFKQKMTLPRLAANEKGGLDRIVNLAEGSPRHLPSNLDSVLLRYLRIPVENTGSSPRTRIFDVWETVTKGAGMLAAINAITRERREGLAMTTSFDNSYACMQRVVEGEERRTGPYFYFCEVPDTKQACVLVHDTATVKPQHAGVWCREWYETQFITAIPLTDFEIPMGSLIVVPEDHEKKRGTLTEKVLLPAQIGTNKTTGGE